MHLVDVESGDLLDTWLAEQLVDDGDDDVDQEITIWLTNAERWSAETRRGTCYCVSVERRIRFYGRAMARRSAAYTGTRPT